MPATPVRATSTRPERHHQRDELVDLVGLAGDLEDEALGRGVDDPGAEGVGQAQRLDALLAGARHLDQRQLALDASCPATVRSATDAPAPGARAGA